MGSQRNLQSCINFSKIFSQKASIVCTIAHSSPGAEYRHFNYHKTLLLNVLKLFLVRSITVTPCLDTITQNRPNRRLVKQQFIVPTQLRLPIKKGVKNSLSLLYQLGSLGRKFQYLIESHPQVFNLHLLPVKNHPKT
jgi:hypothetical protein